MTNRRGQLLIASPRLQDPNFARSVVLLVHHDENGAMGVILNRPLEVTVKDALSQVLDANVELDQPLHVGGPCEGPLTVIHTRHSIIDGNYGDDDDDEKHAVIPGVCFAAERDIIERLLEERAEDTGSEEDPEVKFFGNYAARGLEQL